MEWKHLNFMTRLTVFFSEATMILDQPQPRILGLRQPAQPIVRSRPTQRRMAQCRTLLPPVNYGPG